MVLDNKRLEETFRLLKLDTLHYPTPEHVAQAADNIGRHDVAQWIRQDTWKFNMWIHLYADAYDVPNVDE